MKKNYLLSLIVLIGITLISCNIVPKSSPEVTTGKIVVNGISESGSRGSLADNHESITKLWIRAFDGDGTLIPAVGIAETDGAAILTWNEHLENELGVQEGGYSGSISLNLEDLADTFYIHAMAFDAAGEIVFQGNSNSISEFGTEPLEIRTGPEYSVGDRGPGGGWIFYDKVQHGGVFGDDGKMGKAWRYLEASANDFSLAWDDITDLAKIDDDHKIDNKKVKKKDDNSIVLDEYDWYWGSAGAKNTSTAKYEGWTNTDILDAGVDAVTSATPKIGRKAKGRKVSGDTGNIRRDTSNELRTSTINSCSDWFVPSKTELSYMLSNIVNGGTRNTWNFSETKYWSSSEAIGQDLTGKEYPYNIYWAWAIDFTDGEETNVLAERSEAYHVRPARAF
jgi:hypothetical protein